MTSPFRSYVPDRMTMSAVRARLGEILETDWLTEAESLDIEWR